MDSERRDRLDKILEDASTRGADALEGELQDLMWEVLGKVVIDRPAQVSVPQRTPSWIGRRVAKRYHILELMYHSGCGPVYKADDAELQAQVAILIFPSEAFKAGTGPVRRLREVTHPGIAKVFGFVMDGAHAIGVMEPVEGSTLEELLESVAFSRDEAIDCGIKVADGLVALHSAGLVHGSLTPADIVMTAAGRSAIIPFSLLRSILGGDKKTLSYRDPQRIAMGNMDLRSDIFSLGAVLYEMFCGSVASEESPQSARKSGLAKLPKILRIVLNRCLSEQISQRFPNALALRDALRDARASLESARIRPSVSQKLTGGVRNWFSALEHRKDNEQEHRRFLVSRLSGQERAEVETRLLEDDEYFESMEAAEATLIDDYVTGRMLGAERRSFEGAFGRSERRRDRVHFERRLQAKLKGTVTAPSQTRAAEFFDKEMYSRLQQISLTQLQDRPKGVNLKPEALVNEALIRILGVNPRIEDRAHFLAVAAGVMRRILVDYVRAQESTLSEPSLENHGILELDEALKRLAETDPRQAKIIEMRFFGGSTEEEMANILGISLRTVKRDLVTAKAWLMNTIGFPKDES